MRRPTLLIPLLATLACGPSAAQRAQQTLVPLVEADSVAGPMVACMDAVLASSPAIERISTSPRKDLPRSRYAELRNPPSSRSKGLGFTIEPAHGAPRALVVSYTWPGNWQGRNGMQPPTDQNVSDAEGEMMRDLATTLLRDVLAQCAPTAYGEPACSRVNQGRAGVCGIRL